MILIVNYFRLINL